MTPKKYFNQVFELDKKIDSQISERDAIMQTLTGGTPAKDNPTYSNQFHSTTESAVLKLMEYNDRTNELIDRLVDLKIQISGELSELEDSRYRIILRERYLCSKKWEEVAVEQNYDYSWVIKLHGQALRSFKQRYPDKFD